MDDKLKSAFDLFYNHDYKGAKEIFKEYNYTYEAGLCYFLLKDIKSARNYFHIKENDCTASSFGLYVLDVIEEKRGRSVKYFQIRSFLEIYINLLIENRNFDWAQKLINNYEAFSNINLEVPKFIARVLYGTDCTRAVHAFAKIAKSICYYDAEIHYIDACLFTDEQNYDEAEKCIQDCLKFAPDYYPILKLQEKIKAIKS